MVGPAPAPACPSCRTDLRPEPPKMNFRSLSCPRHHGLLVEAAQLGVLLSPDAMADLHHRIESAEAAAGGCPSCGGGMRSTNVNQVAAAGCGDCGALWFDLRSLQEHVLEVRRRAFGAESFAARVDVHRDAASFLPADVVAGLLTDYELEVEGSSSTD